CAKFSRGYSGYSLQYW
nr:immunoglobulin heavy chain junction region [Macaca mulatta]MOY21233.1 immunoglobulin heavy chain junction region [Macaca mulatta]MOY21428.1 immunoglobulin heavy chain junction region [Macaca mulatta]MOY22885.1 immunoglobulin heavy chain junction region [Macaca mulatta]MOY23313.1 immunoglobulin heavy chain junction region [Macaca mulatta]